MNQAKKKIDSQINSKVDPKIKKTINKTNPESALTLPPN